MCYSPLGIFLDFAGSFLSFLGKKEPFGASVKSFFGLLGAVKMFMVLRKTDQQKAKNDYE